MNFNKENLSNELEENTMDSNKTMHRAPIKKTLYYDEPTQVKFFDFDNEASCWTRGIAYHDVVICGCCGVTIKISEFYDMAIETGFEEDPIRVLDWIDINEKIKGA